MFDVGHMNFFNVEQCGLYRVAINEVHGCDLEETFDLISDWVKDRALASTIPWDKSEPRHNKAKCYCKDIHKDSATGDFFVVLWKSDTDRAGTLWGAVEDNETGTGSVVKYTNKYKGKKVIWGRPCYYWVIPLLNAVVSIKFDHSVCDAQLFEDYVKACINNRVKHKNRKKEYTDMGYVRISYEGDEGTRFQYRFNMSLMSLNTSNSKLQELAAKVTHIVRRESIVVDSKDERSEWIKKFTDVIPFVSAKPKSKKRRIEVKAEASPSVNEIKDIIEKNAEEGRKPSDWDNIGFTTENGITWVDRYRLKDSITISCQKDTLFSAQEICEHVAGNRERYVSPVRRAKSEGEESSLTAEVAEG